MQSSVERVEGDRAKITVTVPAADVDAAIAAAYAAIGAKLRIPGFRQGKAPRPIIDTHVGREAVLAEAQEDIVSDSYGRALSEEDVRTIGQPDVGELDAIEPGKDYTFTAEVTLRPELSLSSADDFSVTVPSVLSSDREIDAQIEHTRERFATLESVDRPVAEDDFALISFVGTVGGEPYDGNTVDKYLYELGRGTMPSEFDAALVGVAPGASAVAEFEIPDTSSNEEFVGKQARFEIDVHEVKTKVLPELDDEFAVSAGGFDSMEDYRADVREKLDSAKQAGHMREVEAAALAVLVERLEGEVPPEMVEGRAGSMVREFAESIEARGISVQDYMQMTGTSPEQFENEIRDQALVRVWEELALEALFRAKQMEISDSDVDDAVREIAGGGDAATDKLREELATNGALPIVREQITHRKALKWLIDAVTVVEEEQQS
ncbi:MAG: trigger factor [Coriobacteriia bacterium]|nr:trigger factor [Coriobacteriia bacterium]